MRKTVSGILLVLLSIGMFTLAFDIRPAFAQTETIYINSDGSVVPSSAPISSPDNVTYTITGDISYPIYNGIVVERNNIVIDGNGHKVQGNQSGYGLSLTGISNVTIENANIENFTEGIYLLSSSNNIVSGNNATANYWGIVLVYSSNNNTVNGNNVTANGDYGIYLYSSANNVVSRNNVAANSNEGIYVVISSNNTINGNNATANSNEGIYLTGSSNNIVSDNNVTENGDDGIYLYSSSNNIVSGNNVAANSNEGIYVVISSNNTISENNATANSDDGIYVASSSNNIVSRNNVTANSDDGIYVVFSSNNTIYHNNFIGNAVQALALSVMNAWDNGYPSGGNYWSDYNGTDLYNGAYQNVTGSDGIGDTPYVIGANNIDHYPLMRPYATAHDVGITALNLSKTVVGRGYGLNVTATTANLGDDPETFNVTVYANTTIITSQNVTLPSQTSTNFTFTWNTTSLSYGNYTLSAYAWPVPGETNTSNNNCTSGWVIVSIIGDITGPNGWPDGKVDMRDIGAIAKLFGVNYPSLKYNPNYDINGDGKIDMKDLSTAAKNFGQHNP